MKQDFEQAAAFGLDGAELCLQPVTEGHQFIDFGDDALLLGKGILRKRMLSRFNPGLPAP